MEEKAHKELGSLLSGRQRPSVYQSGERLGEALAILRKYPKLASKVYRFRSRFPLDPIECPSNRDPERKLYPLHHLLRSNGITLEAVQEVYTMYPQALKFWLIANSRAEGYVTPLHVACCHPAAATKEILRFLIAQDPQAIRRRDASLPFLCYAKHSLLHRPSQYREICDLLWFNCTFDFSAETRQALTLGIESNCRPLIQYLVDKIPDWFWREIFHFLPSRMTFDAALGLGWVLPHAKSLNFRLGPVEESEPFNLLLSDLGRGTTACERLAMTIPTLRGSPDEFNPTIANFENMISAMQPLLELSINGTEIDAPLQGAAYFNAVADGVGRNSGLASLSLSSAFVPNISGLLRLLRNAPNKLILAQCKIPVVPMTADSRVPLPRPQIQTKTSPFRLEELCISGCAISAADMRSVIGFVGSSLPSLKKVSIGVCRNPDGSAFSSADVQANFEAVMWLLRQRQLQELVFGHKLTDHNVATLCNVLKHNTSLFRVQLTLENSAQCKPIAETLATHNTSLQNVEISYGHTATQAPRSLDPLPLSHPASNASREIGYYCLLNQCGRGMTRALGMRLRGFVNLLSFTQGTADSKFKKLMAHEASSFRRQRGLGSANVAFGLLRERPSLWASAAAGLTVAGTRKRRLEPLVWMDTTQTDPASSVVSMADTP